MKGKIKLSKLEVKSFVTELQNNDPLTIKGGSNTDVFSGGVCTTTTKDTTNTCVPTTECNPTPTQICPENQTTAC